MPEYVVFLEDSKIERFKADNFQDAVSKMNEMGGIGVMEIHGNNQIG